MTQYQVHIVHQFQQPVALVFDALADHERLSEILGVPVKRIRDGRDGGVNGVGAIRRLGFGPLSIEETVTELEPQKWIRYRLSRGGFPVRNHSGELRFSQIAGGSGVEWTINFDSALPLAGNVVRAVLTQAIGRGLRRMTF